MSRTRTLHRYSPEERTALLARHKASGLSLAEFAHREGVSPHTMAHWYRGRGTTRGRADTTDVIPTAPVTTALAAPAAPPAPSAFVPVTLTSPAPTPPVTVASTVEIRPVAAWYEIVCASGRRLRVGDDFRVDTLRRLLVALEAEAC